MRFALIHGAVLISIFQVARRIIGPGIESFFDFVTVVDAILIAVNQPIVDQRVAAQANLHQIGDPVAIGVSQIGIGTQDGFLAIGEAIEIVVGQKVGDIGAGFERSWHQRIELAPGRGQAGLDAIAHSVPVGVGIERVSA